MNYSDDLIPRILRDIDDGVLALDKRGCIIYVNQQAETLLGVNGDVVGSTYAEVFFGDTGRAENDSFHQFILDAVCQKDKRHQGTVLYTEPRGATKYLKIKTSFLHGDEADGNSGVVMVISDVTETETLRKQKRDATTVFTCITACVCLYLLLVSAIWFLNIDVPVKGLTHVINAMVVVVAIIIYKKTDFSIDDLGLRIYDCKFTFGAAIAISCAAAALFIVAKCLIIRIAPDFFASGTPFWNWDIGLYSWVSYIFTCILQEFLARSMIYGSIKKMFDGPRAMTSALILSSLLFGVVHIAHGFVYMVAAILLLGVFGGLYEKQRNIWGVAIIHYVLGQSAHCLGFIA